jgi:hypothetical protein
MKRIALLLVGLALMFAPSAAFAEGTTSECQTYGPETCGVTASQSDNTLPFTGMNTTLLVLVGAGLLGTGVAVRRMSRSTNQR